MKILEQALNKINLNKHQVKFFIIAITGFIGIIGKRTFRNLSRYTSLHEKTFSRHMSNLWGYAINEIDKPMITKIIHLLYNESKEAITAYLLSMYNEHHIECYACQKYNDWYIVESLTI